MDYATIELAILEASATPLAACTPSTPLQDALLSIAKKLIDGEYNEALKVDIAEKLLKGIPDKECTFEPNEDPFKRFVEYLEDFLYDHPDQPEATQLVVLLVGVALLKIFIQSNWTGPAIEAPPVFPGLNENHSLDLLERDGEPAYKFIQYPQHLLAASSVLCGLTSNLQSTLTVHYWSARAAYYHQRILLGPSDALRNVIDLNLKKAEFIFSGEKYSNIATRISIELGLAYNTYMDSTRARDCFVNAKNLSGLEVTLSGAMGRRTKFQTFDLPQLVLLAKSKESVANEGTSANVPENVESPDPDAPRLDHTKFSEKVVDSDSNLLVIDQCIILALCLDVKNRNPRHGLTWEEMRVYVERILKNPNNWLVHSMALLLRARLEFEDHKYMDKASLQIQVLVDQYNSALESEYKVATRMKYVDLIEYPPQVLLKKELAQKWLAIGSAASAQKLFEQLEMWEEIAECFIIREMVSEAEQFLRKRIDIHPTPRLWCTLGDVTGNPLYYQKSWELSKGRFTRAKRNLGKIAMHKQNFQEAIEHYEEALKVNTQFADAWFRLGCCALAVSNLELAQKSFARVVQLHPDDGESWSNLASTHIKRGKMKEAFASLKEAIKYKTENWRIWENLLFVCLDLGEFSEALVVLDKLVELKDKEVDVKALSLLVTFVVNEIKTGKAPPGNFMHRNLHQLLEKIVTKIGDNAELWNVYSNYWMGLGNTEEAVKQRHKQCRALQVEGWFDTAPLFKKVVDACQQLTNDQITHNKPKQLYSTRLYLQSVIKKSKDSFEGTPDHDRLKAMVDLITKQEATHN